MNPEISVLQKKKKNSCTEDGEFKAQAVIVPNLIIFGLWLLTFYFFLTSPNKKGLFVTK